MSCMINVVSILMLRMKADGVHTGMPPVIAVNSTSNDAVPTLAGGAKLKHKALEAPCALDAWYGM